MWNPAKLLTCCGLMVVIAAVVAASAQTIAKQEHPYLEEPVSHLVKRIPELKGIRPAADQHELATVLQRVGAKVDNFFTNVVDVIAREDITQQKLVSTVVNGGMPGGVIQSKAQARDNYLIVRRPGDARTDINEYRMDDSGQRLDEVGLQKGFFMTAGFALSSVHFSSLLQWESRFVLLGDQKIGGQNTYVVAFAQLPGEAHTTVTMEGAGGVKVHFLTQGIAWVDKANFQIIQMRTDMLAPQPQIGLNAQTTEITFGEVRFPDVGVPLWLPHDVHVYVEFVDLGSSGRVEYRNVHQYTDYRRYRVSTKIGG